MPLLINYNSKQGLRTFLEERGLGMRKKFGQNFLINPAVRSSLLDALELHQGAEVWEIGPGLGAMTTGLLERGGRVTAFEIDRAFVEMLRELFASESLGSEPAFRLVEGDVFKTWPEVNEAYSQADGTAAGEEVFLLGNLPYNIAAALLADFIEKRRFFKRIVVTVQREVALRMAAGPGTTDYSSFSVLCSSVYKISLLPIIKASSFFPAPRVDSQGVRLDLLAAGEKLPPLFYQMVRALFSTRRKKIKNTLSAFASSVIMKSKLANTKELSFSAREAAGIAALEALKKANISGDCRAETLGIDEFAKLATALSAFLEETVFHES